MTETLLVNGQQVVLKVPSDRVVAERVVRHIQRRIHEDDWRPYTCKADALRAWVRLGGIRVQVLHALNLV
ncbi:hypothetical protein FZZ91_03835 [Synechococcus sp. HB1133]|uniref:hypothetical protein n=1 Tax=unclassified Synechococcus TaxID=2626047 RepID=UPI00140D830F|nr:MULTISPECIES: hypothetical protein [unclassified Synechococcus]MCB4395070.1 hypothetical protein [Synechococcus sp. PH41509]MCB4421970.1 hypothetical protein [Synechococcus sp. HB1133]MCB4430083.1 hypothetical protein [Synechococcus sp. HBA1120]NHI80912.1 hypothetical protein [Synechococcus sp. HB1133]